MFSAINVPTLTNPELHKPEIQQLLLVVACGYPIANQSLATGEIVSRPSKCLCVQSEKLWLISRATVEDYHMGLMDNKAHNAHIICGAFLTCMVWMMAFTLCCNWKPVLFNGVIELLVSVVEISRRHFFQSIYHTSLVSVLNNFHNVYMSAYSHI